MTFLRAAFVIPLEAISAEAVARVGPKALNLARMIQKGFPVPRGFCVTGRAYREHLGRHVDTSGVGPSAFTRVRRSIHDAPLAQALCEEIERHFRNLDALSVAVRSSATAEDLAGQSFAGQHDSFLEVTDLETCLFRVRDCWASLWSDRAIAYRKRNGIDHLSADMAVIVQAMVPAEVAGVMFTVDPVGGRRDTIIIEAAEGLGDAVVTGEVQPDRIVISRRVTFVESRSTSGRPCVDDSTACRLGRMGIEAEAFLGGPLDIEWAIADGEIHILQARPITALPPEPDRPWEARRIWINVNLREVVPHVMTPMTWGLIESLGMPLMKGAFGRLGLDVDPYLLANLITGRVYFNLNTLVSIQKALFGRLALGMSAVFGHASTEVDLPEEDLVRFHVPFYRKLALVPGLLFWFLRSPMRHGQRIMARFRARIEETLGGPWPSLGDEDLAKRILLTERIPREVLLQKGEAPMIVLAGIGYALLLRHLCRRWLGDETLEMAHRLMAGLGGMEDAEAGIALWKLADTAHRDPAVGAAIRDEAHFADIERRLAGAPFLAAWRDFMETHGHHAHGEFELGNPRWSEEPDAVLEILRSHLAGMECVDPVAQARRLAGERRRLEAECRTRLRNPLKRMLFNAVLPRAQEGLRLRETMKSRVIHWFALVRRMLLELGVRLVRRDLLTRVEDIFFLDWKELPRAAAGRVDFRPIIARRRAEHERNTAMNPPPVIFGEYDPAARGPEVVDTEVREFRGIGVSPGSATGPARCILHAGEEQVEPREVLVAPTTDPGWAPYFLNAAAIVMDQGGVLSHGSIVAREYGIPCVVNVGPASRIIQTGQMLEVDGVRGVVKIRD